MRIRHRLDIRHLLALPALPALLVVPLLVAGSEGGVAGAASSQVAPGELGPDGVPIVERQVSSDIVVDWLEEPPADARAWLDRPAAPVDHLQGGQDRHDDAEVDDTPEGRVAAGEESTQYAAAGVSEPVAAATPGQGFAVFSATPRWLQSGYTIRLAGGDTRIEQYRDELAAAASAASAATGLPVRVATAHGGSTNPARGEIVAVIGSGPCGSSAAGCGGPSFTNTEVLAGRVWISDWSLGTTSANRLHLAAHELGHALGLDHYGSGWSDGRQAMYPVLSGIPGYRTGDSTGLRFMAGAFDRPAGQVTQRSYAAGSVRVEGILANGARVRVAVGSVTRDLQASGGRFAGAVPALAGTHQVCVTSLDAGAGFRRDLGCADVVAPGAPFGAIDLVADSFETIRVGGWAADPQTAAPVRIEVRRNGVLVRTVTAATNRPDVAARYPHHGPDHGFDVELPAVAGSNQVCIRVLGTGGGGSKVVGCRTVTHDVDPVGRLEAATAAGAGADISGWALDPNSPGAVQVTMTVDGSAPGVLGTFPADRDRPDVARSYPAHGSAHGFANHVLLTPGDHQVCLTVTNVGLGRDRSLGCRAVHVAPAGAIGGTASPGGLPSVALPEVGALLDDPLRTVDGALEALTR